MILAIDIGGTKTLVAVCDKSGKIIEQIKFPTPAKYADFKKQLAVNVVALTTKYSLVVAAVPGKLDRKNGIVIGLGNLSWKNKPIAKDIQEITGKEVLIENDANMAALYATHNIKPLPHKSLYITISTGIGTGFVVDGVLDPDFLDSEGGHILLEYDDKLLDWEHIASGKSIVAKYGKRASDIDDPKIWNEISKDFAIGIVNLSAVFDPDMVIIGGGVGAHFHKYQKFLKQHIKEYLPDLIDLPKVVAANNAEEAVIYGCVILAKQHLNDKS
jgi:predicted NBD/HSP70 family sugar kinase